MKAKKRTFKMKLNKVNVSGSFKSLFIYTKYKNLETRQEEPLYGVCIITNKLVNDCCLTPTQQFFSHIMARTS
jgi:hypothetical protein